VAVYDAAALGALKAELAGRHAPRVATMPPATPTETVSFRLDSYYLERLGERARQRGMSPGACARLLVVAALEGVGQEGIGDEVAALREGLARFYGNFATAVYTLLIEAGRADEAQAEAFVRDYLLADAGDAAAADEEGEE
jgi:hypothetical protein